MFFRKQKKYEMNIDTANTILQNVLAAEEKAPNTIPFDKLVLRENANTRFYDRVLSVLTLVLALTFLAPLAVVPLAEKSAALSKAGTATLAYDYVKNGYLYIQVEGSRILYSEAYLETTDGQRLSVLSYNEDAGILCFPYLESAESNIYIPVEGSQPLHLLLTPQ